MQNNRCLLLTITVYIRQIEFCRETEIKLAGRKCDLIADCRLYVYIQLWSIESSLSNFLCIINFQIIQYRAECILCLVPHSIIIMILFFVCRITQRQYTTVIGNSEILVGTKNQVYNLGKLILNLLRCYKQMRIVLTEMSASLDTL